MLCDADSGLDELASGEDAEELCRQLLASPGGWRSSTRHVESFLCELDGLSLDPPFCAGVASRPARQAAPAPRDHAKRWIQAEEARRQARADTNASVRKWRSPDGELSQTPSLLGP